MLTRYHGKCLKFGRNKEKAYSEKFICPVCDWRVSINREAQRPRLEDLERWLKLADDLPLIPDEVIPLRNIVKNGIEFRNFVHPLIEGRIFDYSSLPEARFYLRKLEGAEILLVDELNMLRREVHRVNPIAASPPPPADTPRTLIQRKARSKQIKHETEVFSVSPVSTDASECIPKPEITGTSTLQFPMSEEDAANQAVQSSSTESSEGSSEKVSPAVPISPFEPEEIKIEVNQSEPSEPTAASGGGLPAYNSAVSPLLMDVQPTAASNAHEVSTLKAMAEPAAYLEVPDNSEHTEFPATRKVTTTNSKDLSNDI
jgi:[histone H3]-trimethyl-L-lysine4 demethylase